MPKASAASAALPSELRPVLARLHSPGVHLVDSLSQLVTADGEGSHRGWTITEDAFGLLLSKDGYRTARVPWSGVRMVEYVEAE